VCRGAVVSVIVYQIRDLGWCSPQGRCQNGPMVNKSKKPYVDPGWPETARGDHAVTELSSARSGGLSPFGEDTEFPLPVEDLPYAHPVTVVNR
jgi:hypothetical protein